MYKFDQRMGDAVTNTDTKGWLVSVLELGAWFGVLCTGYLADKLSRKYSIVLGERRLCTSVDAHSHTPPAVVVFCIGVIVQDTAYRPVSIFAGRLITGLGVGSLSMSVPLYK